VTGDAVVREEIGRVGENHVHGVFREERKKLQAIALINIDLMLRVVEGRCGKGF